ncbi:MAG: hypothetical protein AM324_005630 [Candidatus Thorarchaeota archaeon SMTZ1-83]|nr:MAG: hypothetical protein AM324_06870 [Candidatus Thorarchaeota archaeon SMTZ1-83]
MSNGALYWVLEVEAYDFDIGVLKGTDVTGKALMISRQLWSVIREDKVVSILIGPGIFKGTATSGSRRVDVVEHLGALLFDPSQLRMDEPLPLVDIINPEVIDPLGTRKQEEIVTIIRKLVVEKGNILAANPLAKVTQDANVPRTAHYDEMIRRINVSHISGKQRAQFILAGTNGPMYRPFVKSYEKRGYLQPDRLKVMATPFLKFTSFVDIEIMSDWRIVEKAGIETKTGIEAIRDEYEATLAIVEENTDAFIFEL